MQVVYSGGSTPTPSPRVQRKQYGYGRPVLPGYVAGSHHPATHSRSPAKEKTHDETESSLRDSIPAMTRPLAITCLVLNILIPGLGTLVSGLSVLCCSKVRLKDHSKKKVVAINTWVALLQFITAFIFLLGWIWSIVWGAAFISYSEDYYKVLENEEKKKVKEHTTELQNGRSPLTHRNSPSSADNYSSIPAQNYNAITITNNPRLTNPRLASQHLSGSSSDSQIQPMIVLQELPVLNQSESTLPPSLPILNARTRHQKILRRQMSDNELSPFNLTQEQLEEIVIHAAPLHRGRLQRDDSLTSNHSESGPSNRGNVDKTSRNNC